MARAEVVASTAGMSAGLLFDYPDPPVKVPFMLNWGGPDDEAYGQNFDRFADDLLDKLAGNGHTVVACNHGELPLPDGDSRHDWRIESTPFILRFFADHPKGVTPDPYAGGLPEDFPAWCGLGMAD
jgi:hypothetical protein